MQIMDAARIRLAIDALAEQVLSDPAVETAWLDRVALVGIRNRGDLIARRIAQAIAAKCGKTPPVGALDITMYRDDLSGRRAITIPQGTEMNFRVDDMIVILVDDVIESGRSVRAALDALVDFGRPRIIRAATLVDRGRREYPIAADYVGFQAENTDVRQRVVVHLQPDDAEDAVYLRPRDDASTQGANAS